MDDPIVVSARHVDAPWIAAHLAVLNEAAVDVRLDVDFHVLAAKRTRDQELVRHVFAILPRCWSGQAYQSCRLCAVERPFSQCQRTQNASIV
jgi:hypothetical protein